MAHLWVLLSFTSAISLATSDALTKRIITPGNEHAIAWLRVVYSLLVLIPAALSAPLPSLDGTFVLAFCAALPLEIAAILLYYRALRLSPLSLSLPFLSFTPVFLMLFSWLVAGDPVSPAGGTGIGLIALGGYTLNLSSFREGPLEPFRAIAREPGSRDMILVAFIYSMTSALGKLAIEHSSPGFFGAAYYLALAVCLLPVFAARQGWGRFRGELRAAVRPALLPGAFDAVHAVTHFFAVSMANVAYMIAIKRSSLLIGSAYGFLLFGERDIRERALGALLMFSGFLVIVLLA